MSKKTSIILIVILLAVALALIGLMGAVLAYGQFASPTAPFRRPYERELELVNTQTLSLEQIKQISAEYISEDLILLQGDGDQLILREYMNQNNPDLLASITSQNGRIQIRHGRRSNRGFNLFGWGSLNHFRGRIELVVPASYREELTLSTVSGDLTTLHKDGSSASWELEVFALSSTSGDIVFGDVKASDLLASTVSGDVYFGQIGADRLVCTSTSGDISCMQVRGVANVSTVSGDVVLGDSYNRGQQDGNGITGGTVSVTSGHILLSPGTLTENLTISSISGDVTLALPQTASFSLDAHTVSGDISSRVAGFSIDRRSASGAVGDSPLHSVRLDTTSGDILIKEISSVY